MGFCPKCNSPVNPGTTVCQKCGSQIPLSKGASGTLDIDQHLEVSSPVESLPGDGTPASLENTDAQKTLNAQDELERSPMDSPKETDQTHILDDQPKAESASDSDARKTVPMPEVPQKSSTTGSRESYQPSSTAAYSEDDFRDALGVRGSSGSDGELRRLWEAAIGSSGKDSRQSLRYERAEASDSIFLRIATRNVADANTRDVELLKQSDYQIKEKLGAGAMGIVYSALQTAVNRTVALKTIKAENAAKLHSRRQFFYEAEITADLDHPNIPPVYELGTTPDNALFYSMKLIQGVVWDEVITSKSREENLEIFGRLADAVAYAHSKNIINRDIKPQNVMLGMYGEVYATDWGTAVRVHQSPPPGPAGTPEYMAPEMARVFLSKLSKLRNVYEREDDSPNRQRFWDEIESLASEVTRIDERADIFSLGAVLFQLIVGFPPHGGSNRNERLLSAAKNEIANAGVDDPLLNVALRAMATVPDARFNSVAEMQEEIQDVLRHGESIKQAERAKELAASAKVTKDYDKFNRAIFGFQESLVLWKENKMAQAELKKTRKEYIECALDKRDFDLVLQTADRTVPAEQQIYERANKAKSEIEAREQRFKRLRKSFVGAVAGFSVLSLGLAGFAGVNWRQAKKNEKSAIVSEQKAIASAKEAKDNEQKAKDSAELAQKNEKKAEASAKEAKDNEQKAKESAELAQKNEKKAEASAKEAKDNEQKAKDSAELARKNEENAKTAQSLAEKRLAQVQIGQRLSKLSLSNLQLSQFNIDGAFASLRQVGEMETEGFGNKVPELLSWATKRIKLIGNADLLTEQLPQGKDLVDLVFARNAKTGFAGTKDGHVMWLSAESKTLKVVKSDSIPSGEIKALAVSPKGDEAIFATLNGNEYRVYVWPSADAKPTSVAFVGNRSFQGFSYSPDGETIVAGINGGMWIRKRSAGWYQQAQTAGESVLPTEATLQVDKVRGRLSQVQWMDDRSILIVALLNGKPAMYQLNNVGAGKPEVLNVRLPAPLSTDLSSATFLANGKKLIMGTTDGQIFTSTLGSVSNTSPTEAKFIPLEQLSEVPQKHRTTVRHLIQGEGGRLISLSDEPVAHLWTANEKGELNYETFLTGVPAGARAGAVEQTTPNLETASFVDANSIVAVDKKNVGFIWDIDRQKQRRRLSRSSETRPESYASPVVGVFERGNGEAIAISQDGVVDVWNLQSGKTIKLDDVNRFSYNGHTPGAELHDTAVDLDANVIVTSARLNKANKAYFPEGHNQEFCVWDRTTGNMVSRWSEPSEGTNDPRISLMSRGTELLIARETGIRIVDLKGKEIVGSSQGVGANFVVANPTDPDRWAVVGRNGNILLWDRSEPYEFGEDRACFLESRGLVIEGMWTPDGTRFMTVDSNGSIAVLKAETNLFTIEHEESVADILGVKKVDFRASSQHAVDLEYESSRDLLHCVVRSNDGSTRYVQVKGLQGGKNSKLRSVGELVEKKGKYWLAANGVGALELTSRVHPNFKNNERSSSKITARLQKGDWTYVATSAGRVLEIAKDSEVLTTYGPRTLKSATSDRLGKSLFVLLDDGVVWQCAIDDSNKATWVKTVIADQGVTDLKMSPDGSRLLLFNRESKSCRLVDPKSGETIRELPAGVLGTCWDSSANGGDVLAYVREGGSVLLDGPNGETKLNQVEMKSDEVLASVHFFQENMKDPKMKDELAPIRYLLLQLESKSENKARVVFVPLDTQADAGGKTPENYPARIQLIAGTRLAVSPIDSLLVTGDESGAVTVWYASPTWDTVSELFGLEGHLGGAIKAVTFSRDGSTLVTSDSKNRLFGWLSEDRLTNKR